MTGTKELSTKRLLMRRYRIEDARTLYEKFGCDPQMYEYSGWNPYATFEMAEKTLRSFIDSYQNADFYGWAIEHQGQLIGTIGAYDHDPEESRIEIGLSIERSSWGKGFATESLICILNYLTDHEGIGTITAWSASDNIGSIKAMQNAGMKRSSIEKGSLVINKKQFDKHFYTYIGGGVFD